MLTFISSYKGRAKSNVGADFRSFSLQNSFDFICSTLNFSFVTTWLLKMCSAANSTPGRNH